MKKTRLLEIIREEITSMLHEEDMDKTRGTVVMPKTTPPQEIKKVTSQGLDVELKEDQLNEMAKIDAALDTAMSNAIERYIADNDIDVEEIKSLLKQYLPLIQARDKEATKEFLTGEGKLLATTLKGLRQLFTGDPTNPTNANRQDPEVNKLMVDREDELIDNQTNNYIYNYFGKVKQQRGRKAGEKPAPSKETSEKASEEAPKKATEKTSSTKTGGVADKKDKLLADLEDVKAEMAAVAKELKAAKQGSKEEEKLIKKRRDLNIEKGELDKKIANLGFKK
jgi:hypothetical protein